MAILLVQEVLLKDALAMRVLKNYFDEFVRLERFPTYARFFVYKEGLPQDATEVTCTLQQDPNGIYEVVKVEVKCSTV
jgi:hypothetical protein